MHTISSGFIGNFKLGDNIVHNLDVLRELYTTQKAGTPEQQELLRKPIIVTIASIAEAVLFDLYLRINSYTREGVPNIPQAVLNEVRTKTIDEFGKYIDHAKSKSLLGKNLGLYDALTELRKLRNRIHIQNIKSHFEPDEIDAFNSTRQSDAENTLKDLLNYMEQEYSRADDKKCVADFVLPW